MVHELILVQAAFALVDPDDEHTVAALEGTLPDEAPRVWSAA